MALRFLTIILLFPTLCWSQTTTNPSNSNNTNNQSAIRGLSGAYSNATGRFFGELNASSTFIFGGITGGLVNGCAGSLGTSTCSNCGNDFDPCNAKRIHNDATLTIRFQPASTAKNVNGGVAFVTNGVSPDQGEFASLTVSNQSPSGFIIPGNTNEVSVTLRWGDICEKLFNADSNGCEDPNIETGTVQLSLGIDEDRNGRFDEKGVTEVQITLADLNVPTINLCKDGDTAEDACNFRVYPGDKKVFVQQIRTDCSFPSNVGDGAATSIRVFREEVSDNVVPHSGSTASDFSISNSSSSCSGSKEVSVDPNTVEGLQNGTAYRFTIGLLDDAKNVGGIIDTTGIPTDENNDSECYSPDASVQLNCHVAVPDTVLALLEDNPDCFIATASFGSPDAPKVLDFREFRNQFLHPTWVGQKVIRFYYQNSPPIAKWIRNHPASKPVVRALLYPIWLAAKACLEIPWIVLSALVLAMAFLVTRFMRKGAKA